MSAGTKVAIAVTVLFVLVLGVYYGFTGPIGRPGSEAAAQADQADEAEQPGHAELPPQQVPAPAQGILGAAVDQSAGEPVEFDAIFHAPAPVNPAPQPVLGFGPVSVPAEGPQPRAAVAGFREDARPGPEYVEYVVREDDSLWTISADKRGDSSRWMQIAEANPSIRPDRLRVGQKIRLPAAPGRVGVNRPAEIARAPASAEASSYVVRSGDTLSSIAERLYRDGGRWRPIYEANRALIGADPDRLEVGMTLRIP